MVSPGLAGFGELRRGRRGRAARSGARSALPRHGWVGRSGALRQALPGPGGVRFGRLVLEWHVRLRPGWARQV